MFTTLIKQEFNARIRVQYTSVILWIDDVKAAQYESTAFPMNPRAGILSHKGDLVTFSEPTIRSEHVSQGKREPFGM